ncbi:MULTISPECIES: aminopeptidase N [unclassified Moraxella]|uniref:aminopeptidase N n=1 Tax=unclassified Moraxella TaxID=2685852 RepID=UPI003AF5F043
MPDVPSHLPMQDATAPQKIYLKDYTPPVFLVNSIDLTIQLFADNAKVTANLDMTRSTAGDLVLLGRELQLESISLNGKALTEADYQLNDEMLVISNAPNDCQITTVVAIVPQTNTSLEGLYQAGEGADKMFVTQCEPEGFRKITFYPDRPDVLSRFTTRLEADKTYPTLLANGNLVEKGDLADNGNRHFAVWEDPTKKPSYLFACVMADLDVLSDHYFVKDSTTSEGREVLLEVYAKSENIEQCHVGMQALKDSMKWDEDHYGRAYDLDRYMIVAVSQFNMGAMENKGLNIFNTACVLSSPETTTDRRNFNVKAVIAHEYFHNWTGNRITCRDWFQLCLKEGFTVFRDQSFSESLHSPAVQRIDDVATLRAFQFPEDASPLAHPPRPDHFVEINNFYTATVYEKGAEIVRMIANTLGKEKFRQGTDEYFRRFDGQAVTVEDLLSALSVGGTNVENFIDWYTQPATPVLSGRFSQVADNLTIHLSQQTRQVTNYPAPKALPIPVKMAIFNRATGALVVEDLLLLDTAEQDFSFSGIDFEPVISLLRDFSAPVQLNFDYSDADLSFLMQYETNGFNRWQASQLLVNRILIQGADSTIYLNALKQALPSLYQQDAMLATRLLDIPAERELGSAFSHHYNPNEVKAKRDALLKQVATHLADFWTTAYQAYPLTAYQDNAKAMGERAWRNVALDMALTANIEDAKQWAVNQYQNASCMSERLGALSAVVNHQLEQKTVLLADFYQRFSHDDLAMDLWFGVQAGDTEASVDAIFGLTEHTDFDLNTPNRVRAVLGGLIAQPTKLWSNQGLSQYLDMMVILDKRNPLLASRLLQSLSAWNTLSEPIKSHAKQQLLDSQPKMTSKNVKETLATMLNQ